MKYNGSCKNTRTELYRGASNKSDIEVYDEWYNTLDGIITKNTDNRLFDPSMKLEMFNKNPVCYLCDNKILSITDAELDHILPYSAGGKTEMKNAGLSHANCNKHKSNKLIVNHLSVAIQDN